MSSSWIAIYMPLFILLVIIFQQQYEMKKFIILKIKKKKGLIIMTNEIIKKHIGKTCKISTGSFVRESIGKIIEVNENWIEVETKKGKELINADFIQSIRINSN